MTNLQSVEQDGVVAGNIFAMLDNANRGVNWNEVYFTRNSPIYLAIRENRTWKHMVKVHVLEISYL